MDSLRAVNRSNHAANCMLAGHETIVGPQAIVRRYQALYMS